MRLRPLVFAVLVVGLSHSAGAQQSGGESAFGVADRALVASEIYAALPVYFAHWEGLPAGFDLPGAYRAYLEEALAAPDRAGFDLATLRFLARFRNGHTTFWDAWLGRVHGQPLGFRVLPLGEGWVVSESHRPGLRSGDVLAALDGEPFEAFARRQLAFVSASRERAGRWILSLNPHLFPARFTLTLADGRRVAVDRTAPSAPPATRFEGQLHDEGRIGYLRLPTFGTPAVQDSALAFLARHPSLPALVLDVRGNSGGDTPGRLLTALMDRPYRTTVQATPMAPALLRAYFPHGQFRWASETVVPEGTPYAGRVVVVADAGCGSACEDLLIPLKDTGRATLVGDTTAGSTGQPYVHRFPNGMQIVIGMKREAFPDGRPFEGVGVAPDVRVGPTADDLRAGRDPAFDRALALARATGGRSAPR